MRQTVAHMHEIEQELRHYNPKAQPDSDVLTDVEPLISKTASLRLDPHEGSLTVGIVGAGWYGCHLAMVLRERGFKVQIFERNQQIFTEGSRWNQFRLHQGFHYARSHNTRVETIGGFHLMRETYPELTTSVRDNLYVVADQSLLDLGTVIQIMDSSGLAYKLLKPESVGLKNCQGVLRCYEQVFLPVKCQEFFSQKLKDVIHLNTNVTSFKETADGVFINDQKFDFALDCTYNHMELSHVPCFYEPCLTLLYKFRDPSGLPPSYTIIDGNFLSLFEYHGPNRELLFTLTSVAHTPLGNFKKAKDAETFLKNFNEADAQKLRPVFEEEAQNFIIDFLDKYEYHGYFLSCKTKLFSGSANRECVEYHTDRTMSLFGGKITGIFHAEKFVLSWLEKFLGKIPIKPEMARYVGKSLIGNTGYVGSALKKQLSFTAEFDAQNYHELRGQCYQTVICCGANHDKVSAESNLQKDRLAILNLISHLRHVKCKKFILISSFDVIQSDQADSDESVVINYAAGEVSFAANRLMLEEFVQKHFEDCLVVRVPILYGGKMTDANILTDLLQQRSLDKICPDATFQFYPVERLWTDIEIAVAANLKVLHLATESISVNDLVNHAFYTTLRINKVGSVIPLVRQSSLEFSKSTYDLPASDQSFIEQRCFFTQHSSLWGMHGKYVLSANELLNSLASFVRKEQCSNLIVSNLAWTAEQEPVALEILRRSGITKLSVAPTRVWPEWNGVHQTSAEEFRQEMEKAGFKIASLHSVLHNRPNAQLFGNRESQERFLDHMRTVIMAASWLRADRVIFAAPANRNSGTMDPGEIWKTSVKIFRELGVFAERYNVTLCIEPIGTFYGSNWAVDSDQVDTLLAAIGCKNVAMSVDIGGLRTAGNQNLISVLENHIGTIRQLDYTEPNLDAVDVSKQGRERNYQLSKNLTFGGHISLKMRPCGIKQFAQSVKEFCILFGKPLLEED